MVDANANRTREALRVIEDSVRFSKDHSRLTSLLKKIRHQVTESVLSLGLTTQQLLSSRESQNDVGKKSVRYQKKIPATLSVLLVRNFKRAEESLRVLEECAKFQSRRSSAQFQNLRFKLYDLEKTVLRKF